MKGKLLPIICVLLLQIVQNSVADPVGVCPSYDGDLVTYLTDSKSCAVFYKCDNGLPYRYDCPAGLHFSTAINVCVYPEEANCEGQSENNGNSEEVEQPGNGGGNQAVGITVTRKKLSSLAMVEEIKQLVNVPKRLANM
ncbi:Chitin binding Peritrophin-A domain [Popillia japonica]|uniref:Chitin binding Peritrophin-A domain n=1 Tax=Popillia japonica TaxID=7064 RepID=A0AAW1IBS4_POPJA